MIRMNGAEAVGAGVQTRARARFERRGAAGLATIVEGLLLLLFLAASVAVFVRLFAGGAAQAQAGEQLARAIAAAENAAEAFAAMPEDAAGTSEVGDLVVVVDVTPEAYEAGTLYHAAISVYAAGEEPAGEGAGASTTAAGASAAGAAGTSPAPLFTLETAAYVPAPAAKGGTA